MLDISITIWLQQELKLFSILEDFSKLLFHFYCIPYVDKQIFCDYVICCVIDD